MELVVQDLFEYCEEVCELAEGDVGSCWVVLVV